MAANVLIRKQRIRLTTSDEKAALQMRKVLNDDLQSELERLFERVFEQSVPDELYINIDKLSVDMGVMSASDFKRTFIQLLEPKLASELQKQLNEYMKPDKLAEPAGTGSSDSLSSLELNLFAEQEFKALLRFLETGIFPWWYQKEQKNPAELLNDLGTDEIEKLLLSLIGFRQSHPSGGFDAIAERLFTHLDQSGYESIVDSLLKLLNNSRLKVNSEAVLKNRAAISSIFSLSEKKFYRHLFEFLMRNRVTATDNFMVNFFQRIISLEKINTESLRENIVNDEQAGFDELIRNILDAEGSTPDDRATDANERSMFREPEEAFYIGNAGLLLLHPFLQPLFSDSGLLNADSKSFLSEQSRHKAAVLLYYLQSGNADYKEWEMLLNKVLCGMNYPDVMPDDILLTDRDKQSCSELLTSVVSHWSALKGAGTEALRNTFLLRTGKMAFKEDHWLIQVERTGADILLDRLPWGCSTVKLPWLKELILTEW
ncbi:hypothetical protein GZH53_19080 [Flavihumibacter sp. R14]|nr:hypothetical protein [Flavihumibacter soli]